MVRHTIFAGFLFVVLAIAGLSIGGWRWLMLQMELPGPVQEESVVELPQGEGLSGITDRLADAGIIARPDLFRLGARLLGRDRDLKAGEYAFPAGISPIGVLALLESGKTVIRRLTISEGLTVTEIMALVAAAKGLDGDLPKPPGEGRLLPETYFFVRGETRSSLVQRMADSMQAALDELWAGRAPDLPIATPDEALILASIIEKETSLDSERDKVAGVFVNRLRKGMRLQTDPTVIYAITKGREPLGRALLRSDLEVDSPYNTYQHTGLPPGPIANPGKAALAAALHPADVDAIYFVANGTGGHTFSRTLDEHNRNVAIWRKIRDGKAAPAPRPRQKPDIGAGSAAAAEITPSTEAPAASDQRAPAAD